jgi:hypothetical protein
LANLKEPPSSKVKANPLADIYDSNNGLPYQIWENGVFSIPNATTATKKMIDIRNCGLLNSSIDPTTDAFKELDPLQSYDGLILYGKNIYYIDQKEWNPSPLPLDTENFKQLLNTLDKLAKDRVNRASEKELLLVAAATNRLLKKEFTLPVDVMRGSKDIGIGAWLTRKDKLSYSVTSQHGNMLFGPYRMKAIGSIEQNVVVGKRGQAKTLLKRNPSLLLERKTFKDCSGREFKNITVFQYALWALDTFTWAMMLHCFTQKRTRRCDKSAVMEAIPRIR